MNKLYVGFAAAMLALCLVACGDANSTTSAPNEELSSSSGFVVDPALVERGYMTDPRDGQVYKTIKIGAQTWMAENLNYVYTGVKFVDGIDIDTSWVPSNGGFTSWVIETLGLQVQGRIPTGRLYTWGAVMDSAAQFSENAGTKCGYGKTCTPNRPHRGICPEGWHVPTSVEYQALYSYIGGRSKASQLLKSISGWKDGGNGSDLYGFSVIPVGIGDGNSIELRGSHAHLWTASEDDEFVADDEYFFFGEDYVSSYSSDKNHGRSLRCLNDFYDYANLKDGSVYDASAKTLTDLRDNQVYKTVTIGDQTWMAENLNYVYGVEYKYNGRFSDSSSWCAYENCRYGRLYTWSAVMDSAAQFSENAGTECGHGKTCTPNSPHRGICPEGWHVPTNGEYSTLYTYIGGYSSAGSLLKSDSGWNDSGNGTDKYGFSVHPAKYDWCHRYRIGGNNCFIPAGYQAYLWTASENGSYDAWFQNFDNGSDGVNRNGKDKYYGLSLRCLQD